MNTKTRNIVLAIASVTILTGIIVTSVVLVKARSERKKNE